MVIERIRQATYESEKERSQHLAAFRVLLEASGVDIDKLSPIHTNIYNILVNVPIKTVI